MKQYVLDEPAPAAAAPAAAEMPPRRRWPWRALLLLAVVEPVALGALYVALSADAGPVERSASAGPATIAAFAFPAPPQPSAAEAAPPAEAAPAASRIALERGKYVIDLHALDVGPALAMLAKATRATVHGGDVLLREPSRLSRSAVAATPAEAWQAVFGDVASFAVSCTSRGCAVWVAALAGVDARAGKASLPAPAGAAAATDSEDESSPQPAAPTTIAARVAAPAAEQNAGGEQSSEN